MLRCFIVDARRCSPALVEETGAASIEDAVVFYND
jgi:hypothetical protein